MSSPENPGHARLVDQRSAPAEQPVLRYQPANISLTAPRHDTHAATYRPAPTPGVLPAARSLPRCSDGPREQPPITSPPLPGQPAPSTNSEKNAHNPQAKKTSRPGVDVARRLDRLTSTSA